MSYPEQFVQLLDENSFRTCFSEENNPINDFSQEDEIIPRYSIEQAAPIKYCNENRPNTFKPKSVILKVK